MSHFTVLVIGSDPEGQLEPFSENLEVEPYYEPAEDYGLEEAEEGLGLTALAHPDIEHLQQLVSWLNEKANDDGAFKIIDGVIQNRTTRNPDGKWDWYSLGGRWRDFFPVKTKRRGKKGESVAFNKSKSKVGFADSLKKKAIDFEKARANERAQAEKLWALWEQALEGRPKPQTWTEVREGFGDARIHEARDAYALQPVMQACKELNIAGWSSCPVEVFGFDRDAYLKRCEDGALVPYAMVIEGEWLQKGEMGWFGMSNDEISQDDWNKKVRETYESLDDDVLISLYDCHV
jgi:hypothetical protein